MDSKITPVILCGGSGTRLWPRSRVSKPKPFLPLVGDTTLFEQALSRCSDAARFAAPIIVTGAAHLGHVQALSANSAARIVVEPAAKNTAAAIALAAHVAGDDAVLLICPSDHHIADGAAFAAAAQSAAALAEQGWLVAFGIEAKSPDTGFGYLQHGVAIGDLGYQVARFVEKPDLATAQAYLAEGGFSWNGGIFAFRAGAFLAELERHRPEIAAACALAMAQVEMGEGPIYPDAQPFAKIIGESVDYAVMENTQRAAMVPVDMGWSDIGNWQALQDARARDAAGNAVRGRADLVDCHNVLVESDGPRVSVIGLENVIIVVDGDEVLVTSAAGTQLVGKLPGAAQQ